MELSEDDDREITWPTTELKIAELPDGRDLILVQGLEPNLRWRQFSTLITSALSSAHVSRVHLLAADKKPHYTQRGRELHVVVTSILDHEVVAIDL